MGQQSITPPRRLPVLLWAILFLLLPASVAHTQTQATALPLILPSAIAYDAQGNLYIAETGNNTIRKVDTAGLITTIAGTGIQGFYGDNGPATSAQLDSPQGLALDASNHLYIADTHNHRIRKLDLTTGLITTIAGATAGFSGDNGLATAAQLDLPTALAVDANNLYIADTQNYRVRKIATATGLITTVAGNGTQGFSGDGGPATAASIDSAAGLAIDSAGDLYIADTHNHRIRKIAAATRMITTIAGTGAEAFAGDNAAAKAAALALPHGLSIDAAGNLYIADTENHRVRRIDAVTGAITTIAGNGTQSFSGDDGAATLAALDSPRATAISPADLPTLADSANQRVRQLNSQLPPDIHTIAGLSPGNGVALTLVVPSTLVYGTGQLVASLASSTTATGFLSFTLLDISTAVATTSNVPLTANAASFDITALSVGSYSLIASYTGDPTHPSTQSQPMAFRVLPRPLIATPDAVTILYGQAIPALTGTLSGLLPQDDDNLTARFTTQMPALSSAGTYPISVSIAGIASKNYTLTATSAALTIKPAPTVTTLSAPAASILSGSPVTFTAHTASTTTGIPVGSITLMDGATPMLTSTALPSGDASFTTSTLAPGSHTLTALYAGSQNFGLSSSTPALITVIPAPANPSDFTLISAGAATQTIPSGGIANFNFTVQIQGSTLASPITLAATGLPPLSTASFNPAYLPPGATPNTFTLTINTPQSVAHRDPGTSSPLLALLLFPIAGITLRLRNRRRATIRFAIATLASALILCSGCGSRINTGTQSSNPVKTYTVTVTGTATGLTGNILQHSTTVKLLIQLVGSGSI